MATFFGEVLPVISRAVDDDEDEEEHQNDDWSVHVRWTSEACNSMSASTNKKLECDILIIAVGSAATGFAQTYITHDDYEIIGGVFGGLQETDVNTFQQTAPTDKSCYIYWKKSNKKVLVCQCNTDIKPEQSYSWVTELLPCIDLTVAYVSTLCSTYTSDYRGEVPISEMTVPFLRALKTEKFKGVALCPFLEQPNIVSGLPAQILTYCKMNNIAAMLYVCYTENLYLDSITMKTFNPLLRSTPIRDIIEKNPKAEETLKKIVELHSCHNTLYL